MFEWVLSKIRSRIGRVACRVVQWPRIVLFRAMSTNSPIGSARFFQPVQCMGAGKVLFGKDVKIGVFPSPLFFSTYAYFEARLVTASISIGAGTWINNNFCAIAEHGSISIGENCLIGANVEILDSDFHGLRIEDRGLSRPEWARDVSIGRDVFIGSNVKILKGVTIGSGTVVAHGSLVVNDLPAGVVAAGCPARVVRSII